MRVGIGYDVHKLVENRALILGGVEIPWEKGLLGHSDADVLLACDHGCTAWCGSPLVISENISRIRIRNTKAFPVSNFWSMSEHCWKKMVMQ